MPLDPRRRALLRFRGKADRVDRADDGSLLVLDYKTGKADGYRGLTADDPDQGGRLLQLAVYGVAARQHQQTPDAAVRAEYWFVSARGNFVDRGLRRSPPTCSPRSAPPWARSCRESKPACSRRTRPR